MSSKNLESEVKKALKKLTILQHRTLPVKVGKEVVSSIRQNFRSGGFYGDAWKKTKRQEVPFKGARGSYGPLLSKSTHLMSNTDYLPGAAKVTIRNTAPYAGYHNEGAEAKVTRKMKKYFWAKYYEAGGGRKAKSGGGKASGKTGKPKKKNPEAEFWQAMALKKPGSRIKIPKRQFLGPSPKVDTIVSGIIDKELENFINKL